MFTHKGTHTHTHTERRRKRRCLFFSVHVWVQRRMWPFCFRKEHSNVMGRFITVLVRTQAAFIYNNSTVERTTQVLMCFMLNSESIPHALKNRSLEGGKVTVMTYIWIFVCAFFCLRTWILLLWCRWSWQISVLNWKYLVFSVDYTLRMI